MEFFLQHRRVTTLSPQRRKQLFCFLLALITCVTFWPVVHNGFIEYDDDNYIFENPVVSAGLSWFGIGWAFIGVHSANWHPLTWLSHMLDCQLFGLNPGAHHLGNVLFHCANSLLVFWFLDLLTGKFWRSLLVAAIFALHPLRVESVAWAAERKDVLSAFFFLLTLLMYVRHVRAQINLASPQPGVSLRFALLFYLLALLAKPMAVTLPMILLLLDFWPLQRRANFKLQLKEKWPFFFLAIIFCVITWFAQHQQLPAQPTSLLLRLENVASDYLSYLKKILWPHDLSFLYLRPEQISQNHFLLALFVLASFSSAAVTQWRCRPWLMTGWLWFGFMLLPVTAISLHKLSIADRYTYLPGIGFSVMLVWGIAEIGERFWCHRVGKVLATTVALLILFFYVQQTRQQISYWRNTQTLMEHALKLDRNNDVAAQILRIYRFEQEHPGVREKSFPKK